MLGSCLPVKIWSRRPLIIIISSKPHSCTIICLKNLILIFKKNLRFIFSQKSTFLSPLTMTNNTSVATTTTMKPTSYSIKKKLMIALRTILKIGTLYPSTASSSISMKMWITKPYPIRNKPPTFAKTYQAQNSI